MEGGLEKGEHMSEKVSIATLASGAVEERFEDELQNILKNIMDPNTEWKPKRKINLTVVFEPTEDRDFSRVTFNVKSVLAPQKAVATALYIGKDGKGRAVAAEMLKQVPGQVFIDDKTGEVVELQRVK